MKSSKMWLFCLLVLLAPSSVISAPTDYNLVLRNLITQGDTLAEGYSPERSSDYASAYAQLYLGALEDEGLEFVFSVTSSKQEHDIEEQFSILINMTLLGESKVNVVDQWLRVRAKLVAAPMTLDASPDTEQLMLESLIIILREGGESLLIITGVLAYLKQTGRQYRISAVWYGVLAALLASGATAWVIAEYLPTTILTEESVEGMALLLAAILLNYVSAWLFVRREMKGWFPFAVRNSKRVGMLSVMIVIFLVVYREASETLLFLRALTEVSSFSWKPMAVGAFLALLLLTVVGYITVIVLRHLPFKLLFTLAFSFVYLLSVIYIGKAAQALQVSGWLSISPLHGLPTFDWFGVYPTLESLLMQVTMVSLPLGIWLVGAAITTSSEEQRRKKNN